MTTPMTDLFKQLPQSSYDRLRAACKDIMLWDHIDPDCHYDYEPVPDADYWAEWSNPTAAVSRTTGLSPERLAELGGVPADPPRLNFDELEEFDY